MKTNGIHGFQARQHQILFVHVHFDDFQYQISGTWFAQGGGILNKSYSGYTIKKTKQSNQ